MEAPAKRNISFWPKMFSDFLGSEDLPDWKNRFYDWDQKFELPSVNVKETEKELKVEVAAPGFEKKDFNIEFSDGVLTIQAEKKEEEKTEKESFKRQEFSYSSIKRSFSLPDNIENEKIQAKYENGILILNIPKKEAALPPKSKEIKVG
jgi:HSP20 family protein